MRGRYVVASSKPWHREGFERNGPEIGGTWTYAATPQELTEAIGHAQPDFIFFLHWNWKVPESTWSKQECVCFHMTDVPYGRGGSPLQNLILRGHTKTMLTALRMVGEMDAGPVYIKRPLSLHGCAEDIFRRAADLSWSMIRLIVEQEPAPTPQVGEPTIFVRRRPEQSVLPTTGTARSLYDHIRMLDAPTYPPAFLDHGDWRLEFSDAEMQDGAVVAKVQIRQIGKRRDKDA